MTTAPGVRGAIGEWIQNTARHYPARIALAGFALVIGLFTLLLELPIATRDGIRAPLIDAAFTATSAVCVTGLMTVNTGEYWSWFGQAVILLAIKVGGLGIMTLASLLGLAVSRRLGLTQRMLGAGEARASGLGEFRSLLGTIVVVSTVTELAISVALFWRLAAHGKSLSDAAWQGLFYGVSAFNNAGISPDPEGVAPFIHDAGFRIPLVLGVFIGALGFPVYLNLIRAWRKPRSWTLHTKLTLLMVVILTFLSGALLALFEWNNPGTLGDQSVLNKLWQTTFVSVNQRSGGFAAIDHGAMHQQTWLLEDVLMFIGGGSGGTAGGIRVTTLAVLLLAVIAEARGRRDIEAFNKRIGTEVVRQAVAVALLSAVIVLVGTLLVLSQTSQVVLPAHLNPAGQVGLSLDRVLYEVISGFATCGLSTGITEYLPTSAKLTIIGCMFVGRLGSITIVASLAFNRRLRVVRYPAERPLIG